MDVEETKEALETTGVVEERLPLTDTMKRTLTLLWTDRTASEVAMNELVRMFVAQAGVTGTEFQLDLDSGVVIVKSPNLA